MKTAGIVCEYNPFHKGHAYQIEDIRKNCGATHIVGVMSGNFVQRGDFAIYDKWTRAKHAVLGGVDLILELPTVYSLSSAEKFAFGAVNILEKINCVETLCFGSECGSIAKLSNISEICENTETLHKIKFYLQNGMSYNEAVTKAINEYISRMSPNDLLGVEYIKALSRLMSPIEPYTTKRVGSMHDSTDISEYPSASLIREKIRGGQAYYEDEKKHLIQNTQNSILAKLRSISSKDIENCANISEGLENRIIACAKEATSLEELYSLINTKRYPQSRIRRAVLCIYLGLTKNLSQTPLSYVKVLAFNDKGRELLSEISQTTCVPVITKAAQIDELDKNARSMFEFENRATDLYSLSCVPPEPCGNEYRKSPIYIKK